MQKTSVYLTPDEVTRLARLAKHEGTSQAEVIRRAIRTYLPERDADRHFAMAAVADGPGGSVADVDEADLLRDFGA